MFVVAAVEFPTLLCALTITLKGVQLHGKYSSDIGIQPTWGCCAGSFRVCFSPEMSIISTEKESIGK